MRKELLLLSVLSTIIVILLCILIFVPQKTKITITEGLQVNLVSGQEISSPLKITGVANINGWAGFEGQVGTVKLLDQSGKQLGQTAILTATTNWMEPPVDFEANLFFVSNVDQPGTLVFHNENPSGDSTRDKIFTIPVKIK
jgi:hypothetical protein